MYYKSRRTKRCRWIRRILGGIVNGCRSFCLQTSIHGFNHIAAPKRHWIERLVWTGITAMAVWGVVDISLGQWKRYKENPTVVTLEKDYRTWNYTMIGVTACEENRTNADKVEKAIKSRWKVTPKDTKYYYYARFVDVVANSDLDHLGRYEQFIGDPDLNVDLYELAVEVMPEPRVKLQDISTISTDPHWVPVMTEVGACYTINSLAVAAIAIVKPTPNTTRGLPVTCKYSLDPCYYIIESQHRTNYYAHSAFDIPDTLKTPINSYPTLNYRTSWSTTETCSGPEVRDLPPSRRHCHYADEPSEPNREAHSNNICRQGCKSRFFMKLCGCKPFHYYFTEGPLCSPAGMWCIEKIPKSLPAMLNNTKCPCAQQCDDAFFRVTAIEIHIWTSEFFKNRGTVRYTLNPPRTRYMRQIVFHFQDLVVSFGGAAGLFLGASFISFVEIGYLLIERIPRVGRKKTDSQTLFQEKAPKAPAPYEYRIQELTYILEGQKSK